MNFKTYLLLGFLIIPLLIMAQWRPAVRLTQSGCAAVAKTWSVSASYGGIVHVVWRDTRSGRSQVYYKRSQNHGISWEAERQLTKTSGNAENATVSIAGVMNPVTHVIWDDDRDKNREIYYKRSTDWGVTWSKDIRLTSAPDSSFQAAMHGCVCCGADVRIVWVDKRNGNADIYYKYSTDNGIEWSEDIQITDNKATQMNPSLAFCRELVQIVWTDIRNGRGEIWGRRSTDCGVSWSDEICISHQTMPWAAFPTIAHVDSSYHLFWAGRTDTSANSRFDIFYNRTTDLGLTWEPNIPLTHYESTDSSLYPSCIALGSTVHLTWVQPNNGIYYKRSTDNGSTWEKDTCLIFLPEIEVWNPSVAISGKCVHIVWHDNHQGSSEIYYKRDPTGQPVK